MAASPDSVVPDVTPPDLTPPDPLAPAAQAPDALASETLTAEEVARLDAGWQKQLIDRNRKGARVALWFVLLGFPAFGIVDYISAPQQWLPLIWGSRLVVVAETLVLFRLFHTDWFARHIHSITAAYMFTVAAAINAMIIVMGGLASHYYAGITIVVVGSGLMYLWPAPVVWRTYAAMVGFYVLPNLAMGQIGDPLMAVSNVIFCSFTAAVVARGQILNYRAAHEQFRTQAALDRTRRQVEAAHVRLQEREAFKSQFFANITHELKTPLAMILSPIELIEQGEMGPISDSQGSTLRTMLKSGTKLLKLINDLLDLSKLEESALTLRVAEHDLVPWTRGLMEEIEALAIRKRIGLDFHVAVPEVKVWCDLERIERVVVNLLSNATKFTPPGGRVDVYLDLVNESTAPAPRGSELEDTGNPARQRGPRARLKVRDTGCGFAPDKAAALFERFYQVDMAGTRKFGGTGIGLALARELVQLHGGAIWAEGAVGEGATFYVEFLLGNDHFDPALLVEDGSPDPAALDHETILGATAAMPRSDAYRLLDIAEVTERRVVERDADEHTRPYTVLIVEDTPDIIRIIHMALRRHFKVMAAPDGMKGLELAQRERPDLVVTDLMMPGIDGLELTRRLRADPAMAHVPIVMLTARGALEDRVKGIDTGVNAYLQKPFSARELLSTVRSLLDLQAEQASRLLTGRMDSLETITGGLAHEINNPLNYIKNGLQVIEKDVGKVRVALDTVESGEPLSRRDRRELERISGRLERMFDSAKAGVQRIGGAVDLMRRYSREGYARVERPTDLWAAASDVTDLLRRTVHGDVQVHTRFEGEAEIEAVPEELNQVLSNLVQNAIEASRDASEARQQQADAKTGEASEGAATRAGAGASEGAGNDEAAGTAGPAAETEPATEGAQVWVEGRVDGGQAVLSVRDNGFGISDKDLSRVFTAFYTTKGPGRGMGMGLTITWRVVQAMGGRIDVTSPPGSGACFTVRVPLLGAAAALVEAPALSAPQPSDAPAPPALG